MTTAFTFQPSLGVVGSTNYATRKAKFGDGYSQEVGDGINNASDTWPLTFTGDSTKIAPIRAFIAALQGYQSFYWTPPLRAQGLFRANQMTVTPLGNGIYTLTVTFTEVF